MSQKFKSRKPHDAKAVQRVEGIGPEICPQCYSDLIQPIDASAMADGKVTLTLRCPECHHRSSSSYSWEEARRFGRVFAAGKADLRAAHADLQRENFSDEVDCFVLALASDLIGPDDFAPYRFAA